MIQIELLNKIRQEIERLKKLLEENTYYLDNSQQALGYSFALDDFDEFLDTLQEENNGPIKARVKESGKIVEGFFDGKGHFDVPVDHDIFNRYDIDELVFAPLQEQEVDLEKEIENCLDKHRCMAVGRKEFIEIATHFYNLGKQEKSSLPFDAEKAAEKYTSENYYELLAPGDLANAFLAGAEWQKEQDNYDVIFHKGMMYYRKQMLEDAVEGEICGRVYDHVNVRFADGVCKYLEPKNISHIPADVSKYNIGDKVRILVLKAEEE